VFFFSPGGLLLRFGVRRGLRALRFGVGRGWFRALPFGVGRGLDDGENRSDLDGFALGNDDFGERSRRRRRNFGVM
jgi:hypothetical protein